MLDSTWKIPLTCYISCVGDVIGCAPVFSGKRDGAPEEIPHRLHSRMSSYFQR